MSRKRKSYNVLLNENRELLLHDKMELERIYTKIDQKAIVDIKKKKQVQS
ncbi:hypothetical protein SRABI96_04384 [Peribacillus sp. Bi96]|nr:FbpB family small basic protein [Peribacillus sp. Bi96]CAH0294594.1 hypothetical protein SRABI96_04384 [Peribacillus sp. Bi96]